jgi:predicted Fe-Mo cluster-binding NifX family protein
VSPRERQRAWSKDAWETWREKSMKVAVSAAEGRPTSDVEQRFGRSKWFLVFDTETGDHIVLDNLDAAESPSGAGVATAQAVIDAGAECVVTGRVGPNASRVLEQAGVRVIDGASGSVEEVADRAGRGEL